MTLLGNESDSSIEQRRRMVADQIRARGVHQPRVLAAMERLPRHHFVPAAEQHAAYEDRALCIERGQTISQPYIVAYMTALLEVNEHHRVLEIGTGSGYQTALLCMLAGEVFTVERIASLSQAAQRRVQDLGIANARFLVGDGSVGLPDQAPFDRMMVTAAAPDVSDELVGQLRDEGKLVVPVGGPIQQTLVCVTRRPGRTVEVPGIGCRFVKLIGAHGWEASIDDVHHEP